MKVTETIYPGEYDDDRGISILLETNSGKSLVSFGSGEPEDMTLGRDLNDAYSISDMLKQAYEAGKNGEDFNITEVKGE